MKKTILSVAAMLMMSAAAQAGGIEVVSNSPLNIPFGDAVYAPVISPTGEYVLVTSNAMEGIQKYDLATGRLITVTKDKGAGYNPQISADGSLIVYRQSEIKNRLRYNTVKGVDVATGKTTVLVGSSRNVTAFDAQGGTAFALENKKLKAKRISGEKVAAQPMTSIENGNLMLTRGGKTVTFNPKGNSRYLWTSVSPDGKKVLFAIPEQGMVAYVCDINGNNITRLGRLSAPKWMGNDWVVGMVDKDNGEVITSSSVVAVRATGGDYTTLTDASAICMYPTATADASKIVYNTADGQIFLMNVKTK